MNFLTTTTMMHYLAIRPFTLNNLLNNKYDNYILTIIISTTLSILWHINKEPYGILLYLDYLGAFIWFCYDLYLADSTIIIQVIFFNLIIFLLNIISLYTSDYVISHSFWHILSAIKCYYVSDLIVRHNKF